MSALPEPLPIPDSQVSAEREGPGPTAEDPSALSLRDIALAAVGEACVRGAETQSDEIDLLLQAAERLHSDGRSLRHALRDALHHPHPSDARLVRLSNWLHLSSLEVLTIALAASVEDRPLVGRMLAFVQSPVGGSRPTLGLVAHAFAGIAREGGSLLPELLNGLAVRSGLLVVLNETAPIPEKTVQVSASIFMALAGYDSNPTGIAIGLDEATQVQLPESVVAKAQQHARALGAESDRMLILRSGSPSEARSTAFAITRALGRRPAFIESDGAPGIGPWLLLRDLIPVYSVELAPGERRRFRALPGYSGPALVICGPEGSIEPAHGSAATWTLTIPTPAERRDLWMAALGPDGTAHTENHALADHLASHYRHSAGRIAHLGRLARHQAALAGRQAPESADIVEAAWTGEGGGLDALAQPMRGQVSDDALVAGPALRANLESLILRCHVREDLATGLGASAVTRYRTGVRALFTGPSGTGKTLAADWIATRLGLPLYRVDLASVTSKYIGETEKNLSQLLARAEQAEVILLFDEADSLFGKRTDIADANDRFANAQTNYLLQRIENYDGIVILTSNSQARFDDAFARRLDFIIEFPLPGPEERRAIWRSHLGPDVTLQTAELNRLAVLLDLSGGHIRNAVLLAAVHARRDRRPIAFGDVIAGLEAELRKLGRQVPLELQSRR